MERTHARPQHHFLDNANESHDQSIIFYYEVYCSELALQTHTLPTVKRLLLCRLYLLQDRRNIFLKGTTEPSVNHSLNVIQNCYTTINSVNTYIYPQHSCSYESYPFTGKPTLTESIQDSKIWYRVQTSFWYSGT